VRTVLVDAFNAVELEVKRLELVNLPQLPEQRRRNAKLCQAPVMDVKETATRSICTYGRETIGHGQ
jgi:hypothetical protein